MKALAIGLVCLTSLAAAEDFKTIDGREFKDATLGRVEPDGIVLMTSAGITKLYFTELPKEVQQRFHYDPARAAAFAADETAQLEAARKQREEARQREVEQLERMAEEKNRERAELEEERQALEEQRQVRPQRRTNFSRSAEGVPEEIYELVQDHTIVIRGGINGASIRLRRGERYPGRILADHGEIDIRGYSYWVPVGVLRPVRD